MQVELTKQQHDILFNIAEKYGWKTHPCGYRKYAKIKDKNTRIEGWMYKYDNEKLISFEEAIQLIIDGGFYIRNYKVELQGKDLRVGCKYIKEAEIEEVINYYKNSPFQFKATKEQLKVVREICNYKSIRYTLPDYKNLVCVIDNKALDWNRTVIDGFGKEISFEEGCVKLLQFQDGVYVLDTEHFKLYPDKLRHEEEVFTMEEVQSLINFYKENVC